MKLEKPVILIGGAPFACGITKMLSLGSECQSSDLSI